MSSPLEGLAKILRFGEHSPEQAVIEAEQLRQVQVCMSRLHWQGADGVTYTLVSWTLGLSELLATAESIP